jgi:diguanylate cyclase (GGDEF)-like protein/PAS domain S-box-containing protein
MLSLSVLTNQVALQRSNGGIDMKPLKWQNRIRLVVGVAFVSLIGLLYATSSTILINSLKQAEKQEGLQIVKGVLGVFDRFQEEFSARYADWAAWDDSYQFIQDGNQKYIDSGLAPEVFTLTKVNLILFVQSSGRIVYGTGFDYENQVYTPIPEKIKQSLAQKDILFQHSSPQSNVLGIIRLPQGLMRITSRPIVSTDGKSPIRGTLIVGRYLNEETIEKIARTTRSSLAVYAIDDKNLPTDFQKARSLLSDNKDIIIRRIDEDTLAGYTLLEDIYQKPALLMRVEIPREIYRQGRSSLRYLMVSLTIVGIVFGAVTLRLLDRLFITWQKQKENEERYRAVVEQASEGIIIVDAQSKNLLEANPAFLKLLQYTNSEILSLTLYDIVADEPTHIDDAIARLRTVGHNATTEAEYRRQDGSIIAVEVSANIISYKEGKALCVVVRDITERKQAEEALRESERRLSWQASHDALTELANRREFEQCLKESVESAKHQEQQHALLYLDLDQFKIVNDTCGHIAGDELLRQISAVFKAGMRKSDILARLGGDEFGILLYQCPLEQALQIAQTLCEKVQKFRFVWQEKVFSISVSIGLVSIDAMSQSASNVMSAADVACYSAKNRGRNRIHVYQLNDRELEQHRGEMQWVSRIPRAIEENRFRLYYQKIVPIVASENKREHREILLRLEDENGKIVPPMAFIPAAERYNLMHLIDRWVISNLFALLAQQERLHPYGQNSLYPAIYAVNLSGASINDDNFINFVQEQFDRYPIAPADICFEITETLAITNLVKAEQTIHRLRELGCHFALDDFGSGMSSFAYLKNLSVDYLKIDGVFIKNITTDAIAAEMVEAVAKIASVIGIQTIAEFVEDEAILMKLKTLKVDYAQGYGISKPTPLEFF